jgi:large subunit ribosomal protein L25
MEIPDRLELDVSSAEIGDTLRVSALRAPEGATILDDPETVVATVTMPTRVVEPEPEPEELEEGEVPEGEEGPEGEAPTESEAEAAGEPETPEG